MLSTRGLPNALAVKLRGFAYARTNDLRHRSQVQQHLPGAKSVDTGDPVAFGVLRQAEVEVEAERRRDLVGEKPADTTFARVDPADELAFVPAQ